MTGFNGIHARLILPACLLLTGCTGNPPEISGPAAGPVAATPDGQSRHSGSGHEHAAGAHGGAIVEIGREDYHAEPVFAADGTVRLYILGSDETRVDDVPIQTLSAWVRPASGGEAVSMEFLPVPQPGDRDGRTSLFEASLPESQRGVAVEITIPSLRVGDDRFRISFASPAVDHGTGMPPAAESAEADELYGTPGGIYTAADIAANGPLPAAKKFAGVHSAHDLHPRPGDRICPITLTKANDAFPWTVNGRTYLFCCPPCIDEFVRMAKTEPEKVREPGHYVQQ